MTKVLTSAFRPTFRLEDNGIVYLSVGYMLAEDGRTGWFDHRLEYCPFCGRRVQHPGELDASANGRRSGSDRS